MGKRSRKRKANKSAANGAPAAPQKKIEDEAGMDISEDCVNYESPTEADTVPGAPAAAMGADDAESDDDESSADEMELVSKKEDGANNEDSDVEVTFDFYDPTEGDEKSVENFLAEICDSLVVPDAAGLEARKLAKAVCAQTRVGTVVKIDEDAAPIGFITALGVQAHRELLEPLHRCLSSADAPESILRSFVKPVEEGPVGPRVGLILTGRVVNLPVQLIPKLFEALLCEIEWATEDEPTPEQRKAFDLHWFLYITDVYPSAGSEKKQKQKKPTKKKARAAAASNGSKEEDTIAFTRAEDEILLDASTHTVTWDIPGEEAGPEGLTRRKMGMFIKKEKMSGAFENIKRLFGVQIDVEGMDAQPIAAAVADGDENKE